MFTLKILQVLDPSHESWVQGGVFKDLKNSSKVFHKKPVYLGSPFKTQSVFHWAWSVLRIIFSRKILFSSLTPLENYSRVFSLIGYYQQKTLWFTHNEQILNKRQLKAINRCGAVLVHSSKAKMELQEFYKGKIIVMLAAIEFTRFSSPSISGEKIVWVGTYSRRKNPKLFLNLVRKNPHLQFRILGKNWDKKFVDALLFQLKNLEYFEIEGAINSAQFNGCDIYLCTSEIEGAPMPLLESIAAGLNPISSDVGFVRDIFEYFQISEKFIYTSEDEVVGLVNSLRLNSCQRIDHNRALIKNLSFENLGKLIQSSFDV
jgi:glycosyltransferase involved in cell wall biosynthesis